ncbi:MAG: AfsR/SARP family transcriptional regulator, partial [Actinomycetes bacterium]
MIHYHVLGPLESRAGVRVYAPRGPKIGKVLALLLLRANQVVSVRALADELWDQRPPRSAVTTIRTHIYHLRKALEAAPMPPVQLMTEPTGYRLVLDPGQLDAEVFARTVDRGRALLGRGEATEAASVL